MKENSVGKGGSALKKLKNSLKHSGLLVQKKSQKKTNSIAVLNVIRESKAALKTLQKQASESNPFEYKFAKPKFEVLNKPVKKNVGKPGVARERSESSRAPLLIQRANRGRESVVVDKRFGENDPTMSVEDKMLQRMLQENRGRHEKSDVFNLQEEDLTHMGHSLGDMQEFDEAGLGSDDEDNGNLPESMVKYHFGGFEEENQNGHKSRNDVMKEIIQKSKAHKRERQKQKDDDFDLANEVDAELAAIRGLLTPMAEADPKSLKASSQLPGKNNDNAVEYDASVRELMFERRGKPTDRIKTDQEIAMNEHNRLLALEKERLDRMKPEDDSESDGGQLDGPDGDDLEDNDYERNLDRQIELENEMPLTYKDGKLINDKIFMKPPTHSKQSDDDEDDYQSEEDLEVGDQEESQEEKSENESDGEDKESDEEEEESNEELAIVKEESDDDFETAREHFSSPVAPESELMEELPFTFKAPENYSDFASYVLDRPVNDHKTVIDRLCVLYNPKISPKNKDIMEKLTLILWEHVDAIAQDQSTLAVFGKIKSHLVSLSRTYPSSFAAYAVARMNKMKKSKGMPNLADLLFFLTLPEIFSASDVRHPVMTPAMLLMARYLEETPKSTVDVLKGLFLSHIIYSYIDQSKRYVPELLNYCQTVLSAYCPVKSTDTLLPTKPLPFLNVSDWTVTPSTVFMRNLLETTDSDEIHVAIFKDSLGLVGSLLRLYNENMNIVMRFQETLDSLASIPSIKESKTLQENIKASIASTDLKRRPLQMQKKKAMPIPTFAPKFQERYSLDKKRYDPNRERANLDKTKAEYKREFKGAVRELRKDSSFMHRAQMVEKRKSDAEYNKKTAKIMGQLAEQEGSMRGVERITKKMKKF